MDLAACLQHMESIMYLSSPGPLFFFLKHVGCKHIVWLARTGPAPACSLPSSG